jgi:hypothetical protein
VFDTLKRILAHGRPTRVFTYFRRDGAGAHAVAVATVSDRVTRDFPFDGMPVLARAYIRPADRKQGLYAVMLRHRLGYCAGRWGKSLRAIHLGTASPAIERSLRRSHDGLVAFLGNENLGEAGYVRALLALTESYLEQLSGRLPECLRGGQEVVLDFLRNGAGERRARDIAGALAALASNDPAIRMLERFLCSLPTLE